MTDGLFVTLTLLAALGSGLIAGVFFAFSTFVMAAFARLPAATGAVAMRSVNRTVLNPLFLSVFGGTALLSAVLAVLSVVSWPDHGGGWSLAAGVSYVAGSFVLTAVVHVPRNEALGRIDPDSGEAAAFWARYVPVWTAWNHVRTLASLAACALFVVALVTR
ncbi:anthrone oxygenase family protein [Prauserella cavernicola]|uniref:DUF1772 domain-containing protein n=1 Tax=Prauserella cavernicola TaxID=2800127 RepID=A0A934QXR0_9PSEU|nr:anthrone oxygenase family protein [Prauserella cavernicola]MBK1788448.1 DUF1772 domain-containing protein [Prauserella cavernicola]